MAQSHSHFSQVKLVLRSVLLILTILCSTLTGALQLPYPAARQFQSSATTIPLPIVDYDTLSADQQALLTTDSRHLIFSKVIKPTTQILTPEAFKESSTLSYFLKLLSPSLVPHDYDGVHPNTGPSLDLFELEGISWLKLSASPSIFDVILRPFSTLELTLVSTSQFDAVITNSLVDNQQSFGTELKTCQKVSPSAQKLAAQRVSIQERSIQKKLDGIDELERLSTQTSPSKPTSASSPSTDNYSTQREFHSFFETALIADQNLVFQCTISIPLYSYYAPLSSTYLGLSVPSDSMNKIKAFLGGSNNSQTIFVSFRSQHFHFPTILVALVSTAIYLVLPYIIEMTLLHLSIGAFLGSLSFLALVLFILYKITPFRRVAVPVGIVMGYFVDVQHTAFRVLVNLYSRYPLETTVILLLGALVGVIITIKWFQWNSQYSLPTVHLVRILLLLLFSVLFQSFIPFITFATALWYISYNSTSSLAATTVPTPVTPSNASLSLPHTHTHPHGPSQSAFQYGAKQSFNTATNIPPINTPAKQSTMSLYVSKNAQSAAHVSQQHMQLTGAPTTPHGTLRTTFPTTPTSHNRSSQAPNQSQPHNLRPYNKQQQPRNKSRMSYVNADFFDEDEDEDEDDEDDSTYERIQPGYIHTPSTQRNVAKLPATNANNANIFQNAQKNARNTKNAPPQQDHRYADDDEEPVVSSRRRTTERQPALQRQSSRTRSQR